MISKLTGIMDVQTLFDKKDPAVILDVKGVGYEVYCSEITKTKLPSDHSEVSLYIETHVREDRIQLFGFIDLLEKQVFKRLITVQGVGMKAALAILSAFSASDVLHILQSQDTKALTQADGIGPKIATRIIHEISEKVSDLTESSSFSPASDSQIVMPVNFSQLSSLSQDAISALVNLGYKDSDARHIVVKILKKNETNEDLKIDDIIRLSLQEIHASLR